MEDIYIYNDSPWQTTKFQWCSSWKLITMAHPLYWQNYMYSKLHACTWTAPRNSARSHLTCRTSSATVCYAACRIIVHVHCILNSWAYQSRHATENWKNEFSDVKRCFWFLCRITYYTVHFFSTFSSIFITFHEGTRRPGGVRYRRKDFKGNALHWDQRFGYDIHKCPIYRGQGFLLELSLDGTGTWVSVRYKRVSGLSEDVIREVYCTQFQNINKLLFSNDEGISQIEFVFTILFCKNVELLYFVFKPITHAHL